VVHEPIELATSMSTLSSITGIKTNINNKIKNILASKDRFLIE
jgi:hypothetical protein